MHELYLADMRRTDSSDYPESNGGRDRLGRSWLRARTIPEMRELAKDLQGRGEDVRELVEAVESLDQLLKSIERLESAERRGRVVIPRRAEDARGGSRTRAGGLEGLSPTARLPSRTRAKASRT